MFFTLLFPFPPQIRFMGKYNKVAFEKWLESEAEKQEKHIVIRTVCGPFPLFLNVSVEMSCHGDDGEKTNRLILSLRHTRSR